MAGTPFLRNSRQRSTASPVAAPLRDLRACDHRLRSACSQDIIRSRGPGYRLNQWITVRDADSEAEKSSDANDAPAEDPDKGRRERILAELRTGEKLQASAIETPGTSHRGATRMCRQDDQARAGRLTRRGAHRIRRAVEDVLPSDQAMSVECSPRVHRDEYRQAVPQRHPERRDDRSRQTGLDRVSRSESHNAHQEGNCVLYAVRPALPHEELDR